MRTAPDGEAALAALSGSGGSPVELALLDVMMPGMDGYELLRRMKADPALRDIPVLMISALDQLESVVRCIELGAEDYLPKPFEPVLLRARIGACLEKKRLRDQDARRAGAGGMERDARATRERAGGPARAARGSSASSRPSSPS